MVETQDTNVYLDLSEIDGDPHQLFPGIGRVCELFGIDIARDPIPVRPGAHYQIGGIAVDRDGRSTLPGLWAVGEVAASGLHGANRMGSNSLLEGLVLGRRAGRTVAEVRAEAPVLRRFAGAPRPRRELDQRSFRVNVEDLTYSLKSMMWREMGVQRNADGLAEAARKLGFWSRVVHELAERDSSTIQLLNMLSLSRLATVSAAFREESRGVHFRSDFPEPREEQRAHTVLTPVLDGDRVAHVVRSREPVNTTETVTR
jgi:L-aspartate oxidase